MGLVLVRIPDHLQEASRTLFHRKNAAWINCDGKTVWTGKLGDLATFEVDRLEEVTIFIDDGTEMANITGYVNPDCNYEVGLARYKGLFKIPEYTLFEI